MNLPSHAVTSTSRRIIVAPGMIPKQKKRILIVDDSPSSLVWQLVLLQEEHYDTLTANHPDEGVRIAKLERPDLVLMDVASRSSDALAACRALRAAPETSTIPIMLVTTHRVLGRAKAELESVCDEHIAKPLNGVEYLMKIRRCLEGRVRS